MAGSGHNEGTGGASFYNDASAPARPSVPADIVK
jgi:hypothetical protein